MSETKPQNSVQKHKHGEIYVEPTERILDLSELAKSKFLPVDRQKVDNLKSKLKEKEDAAIINGQIGATWIVQFEDGSLHIADGYHRFAAIEELSQEENTSFTREIYAKIFPGDETTLWKLRVQAMGAHTKVIPARFITFLIDSFGEETPDIYPERLVRAASMDDSKALMPVGFNENKWEQIIFSVNELIEKLDIPPKQILDYIKIATHIPPKFSENLVVSPSKKERDYGALSVASALAIADADLPKVERISILEQTRKHGLNGANLATVIAKAKGSKVKEELKTPPKKKAVNAGTPQAIISRLVRTQIETKLAVAKSNLEGVIAATLAELVISEEFSKLQLSERKIVVDGIRRFSRNATYLRKNNKQLSILNPRQFARTGKILARRIILSRQENGFSDATAITRVMQQANLDNTSIEAIPTNKLKDKIIAEILPYIEVLIREYFSKAKKAKRPKRR